MQLKDDNDMLNSVKGKLSSVLSEIKDVESLKANSFIDWILKKSIYYKQHYFREKFHNLPYQMKRGDIVWVDFGINVGDEFGDDGTDGHFAMIWAQQGFMFIVIPLSKQERVDKYTVNLGIIEGLPYSQNSYAKLDNIKSIHIRRIKRINGQDNGKILYENQSILNDIKSCIFKNFILDS